MLPRSPKVAYVALAALLPALLLAACGGGGDETGPERTGINGDWKGKTSQKQAISFTVEKDKVTAIDLVWNYGGSKCPVIGNHSATKPNVPVKNDKATLKDPPVTITFESDSEASGSGHFVVDPTFKPDCKPADITFKATPSKEKPSAATPQGAPTTPQGLPSTPQQVPLTPQGTPATPER